MKIIDYLQGESRHSIDVLRAIYKLSVSPEQSLSWKDVKEWLRQHNVYLSDGTFRKRRDELERLGLITKEKVDRLKFNVKITPKGLEVAIALEKFIADLAVIESEHNKKI